MATRASLARGTAPKEIYEGRVHKWERRWLVHKKGTVKTEAMLELLRWIVTDEQCPELIGPRHPNIKPLKRPIIKQPSVKPSEQAAERPVEPPAGRAAEQDGELVPASTAPPATGAGTGAAEQNPAGDATAAKSVAQAATTVGNEPTGELQPPVQDLLPPKQQPEAGGAMADAPDGGAWRDVKDATPTQEPNGAGLVEGDLGVVGDSGLLVSAPESQAAAAAAEFHAHACSDELVPPIAVPASGDIEMIDAEAPS